MGDIDKSPYGDTFSVFDAMIAPILYRNRTFSGYVLHFFAYFLKKLPIFSADEGGETAKSGGRKTYRFALFLLVLCLFIGWRSDARSGRKICPPAGRGRGADRAHLPHTFRAYERGDIAALSCLIAISLKGVRVIFYSYDIICKKSIAFSDSFVL